MIKERRGGREGVRLDDEERQRERGRGKEGDKKGGRERERERGGGREGGLYLPRHTPTPVP